ncbi:hypothetical protein JTE90_000404 [Oedothorax gibbosus]|uniref:RNase H type-1 domain-containing protein n=1 Tax=Oedothorax gibbosus TaxID=931172 RepID=A0AAV6US31_9ARAC|nr:hypothetical protein JTE90_000404 [Oedothorax gibbosus]
METPTMGFLNSDCNRGGSRIFVTYPEGSISRHKIPAGNITSNFTIEPVAIKEALSIYLTRITINPSDGKVIFTDCESTLRVLQKGNTNHVQKINTLLFSIEEKRRYVYTSMDPGTRRRQGERRGRLSGQEGEEDHPDYNVIRRKTKALHYSSKKNFPSRA